MQVNGIIAEYNPFHNGHKYQLEESLHRTEADYTIIVMSGNFVQRGAPALLDKHTRAEMALRCGADLVLELPALYAASSAEYFAMGAVSLLDKLGVVTHLCFGSECGDEKVLGQIAKLLLEEPEDYRASLKYYLSQGFSYPNARTQALMQHYPFLNDYKNVFSFPNNILGIEYIKAILRRQSKITPVAIKRLGSGYHDRHIETQLCSSLAIRQALYQNGDPGRLCLHMPEESGKLLTDYLAENAPVRPDDFSAVLYYKLLLEKEYGYEKYLDVSGDLSSRIQNLLDKFTGFEAFCDLLKTKDMTYTRISRCLLHILLNLEKKHMGWGKALDYVPYAKMLGFRKSATPLLNVIKEHSSIPLISKLADAEEMLESDAYGFLKKDILTSSIYQGVAAGRNGKPAANEFTTPLAIV